MHNGNHADCNRPDSEVQYGFSSHAAKRSQQRGIGRSDTDLMLGFGKKRRRGRDGATIVFMDKEGRHKLARSGLRFNGTDEFYIVMDPDTHQIITVAHREKRLKW